MVYGWAILGGLALLLGAGVMTTSVLGRYFFNRPWLGDYEILELATLFAASAALPWGQQQQRPSRMGALMVCTIGTILSWRVLVGGMEALNRQGQSMMLQIPDYIGFFLATPGLILLALVGLMQLFPYE